MGAKGTTITPARYRQIVGEIPDADVRQSILSSDATSGMGNQYSMHLLNQYFAGQLPTQQIAAERLKEDPDSQPVHEGSTEAANTRQLPATHVGLTRGATPLQASQAFDKAYKAKQKEFFAEMKDDGLDPETRRLRANQEADRYVRMWWDLPRTAQGKAMPMASRDGVKRILEAQGLGKIYQAMKPRVWSGQEVIESLHGTGEMADVLKARRLLTEYFTGEEEADMRSVVRPEIRKQAVRQAMAGDVSVSIARLLEEKGFVPDGKGGIRYSKKVERKSRIVGSGYGATVLPAETIENDVDINYQDILSYLKRREEESQAAPTEADMTKVVGVAGGHTKPFKGASRGTTVKGEKRAKEERDKAEHIVTAEEVLSDLFDVFSKRVNSEEDRIVGQRRQEASRSFQTEAKTLVAGLFERKGIELPEIPRGREGSEVRALWDAQPQELKDNYKEYRQLVYDIAQQKTGAYDYAVYGDYLEEELGIDESGDRMQIELWRGGPTVMTIDYKPDDLKTQIFGGLHSFGKGILKKDVRDGGVAETFVGTGFRDLGGLIRFVADPFWKVMTYDVDENGNPLDPDDWNYRFEQWTERALQRRHEEIPGVGFRDFADSLGLGFASIIPSRLSKGMGTGERKRYASGSYLTDVALSIYNARFLGDDFSELSASTRFWEQQGAPWVPGIAGLMVEVALPLTPAPLVSRVSVASGRALIGIDAAIKSGRFSDLYNAFKAEDFNPIAGEAATKKPPVGRLGRVGRVLENPLREAEISILAAAARNVMRSARGVKNLPKDLRDILLEEARVPRQLAARLAGEMVDLLDFEKGADALNESLKVIRGMHWGADARIMEIFDDLAVAGERLNKAKKTNSIADLRADPQGAALIDEIAAQAALGKTPGSPDFIKGVLHGYLTERMANELLNYVPNNYVMATANVVMPIRTWKRVRKQVQEEISGRLKIDEGLAKESNLFRFENSDDVADLMVDAFGSDKITRTPHLYEIYKKILRSEGLSVDELNTVEQLLRGAIVKKAVTNSYRLTHTGAVWERAGVAGLGRHKRLPRAVQTVMRAVRPIDRIDAMLHARPTPPPARLTPKTMAEGIELPKIELWNELRDKFAGIDNALRKEILAARTDTGDAWDGMSLVMQKYGSEKPINDIMQILLGGATRRGTGFFGAAGDQLHWDRTKAALESHLNKQATAYGEALNTLTPQAIIESIDFLRRKHPDVLLKRSMTGGQPAGMGARASAFKRFWTTEGYNYRKIKPGDSPAKRAEIDEHNYRVDAEVASKTDYADAAVWSFMVEGMKAEIKEAAAANLVRTYPEMVIPLSRPGTINEAIFRDAVTKILVGEKTADATIVALVDDLVRTSAGFIYHGAKGIEGGLNASDMRYVLNAIIGDLYEYGAMNSLSYQRIADTLVSRAGGKEVGLASVVSRSPELKNKVQRILEKHLGATGKNARLLSDKQSLQQLAEMITGRIIADMVEANTAQTIDTMMGNLASTGLPARMDNTSVRLHELKSGLTQISDDFAILLPNRLGDMVNPQEYMLIEDLLKQSASGMLEANLAVLRSRDMTGYDFYMSRVGALYNWTRRATIGGLLGGFGPFPVMRFHGVNVMTAPFIMAITTPQFVLQGLRAIPEAATSFVKPVAEAMYPAMNKAQRELTKIPGAKGAFDWMAYKLARNPNRILFVDKWGSVWTKSRFDTAYKANNIRFSQVSFEFRDSIIAEMRRAAAINPDLSKSGYMKQIWRWFDPGNKTLWSRWAEESDEAFRKATFAAALKQGHDVQAAAKLARNALLDYGAIPKGERETISKGMLFYAFQRQITLETLSTFLRAGDDLRLLRAQMAFTMNQHKMMDTWVNEEDWQRTRLYARTAESFDEAKNYVYGPEMPAVAALGGILNMAGGFIDSANWAITDQPTTHFKFGDVIKMAHEGYLAHPVWEWGRDMILLEQGRGGELTPQGIVRPEWVQFWQSTGQWSVMQRWFDIKPMKKDRRRHNEYLQLIAPDGTPMYSQWKFGSKGGRRKFLSYYYLGTMTGTNRAIRDWSTNAMIGGDTDELIFKKRSQGSKFRHLIGMETQGSLPGEAEMIYTLNAARMEELKSMIKE